MMKKLFLTASIALIAQLGFSQYYYVPHITAGTNPGGLNNDAEQPAQAGWVSIQASSASPVWSPNQTIPFTFNFNGSTVSSYKVSSSGILTFNTGAASVPSTSNAALPNANIPDNSICVWGISGHGSNDAIQTKVFGTAPNQQLWIQFTSFTLAGGPATGTWTYWSIVLEETSNKIYIVDQRNYTTPSVPQLTLGIQINGTTAFQVPGSPAVASTTDGGTLADPTDNTFYEFGQGTPPADEAALKTLSVNPFVSVGSNVDVNGTIYNNGTNTINSITIKYTDGTNTYTDNKAAINIAPYGTYNFTHKDQYNVATTGAHNITAWIELNGDNNHSNDTLKAVVNGVSFTPAHNVVIEEGTGTWCGWCPRGTVFMDSIHKVHPNTTTLIAVHNGDPMVVSDYDAGVGTMIAGYPSVLVNRNIVDDPSNIFTLYNQHINDFGVANVDITAQYNASTKTITATGQAHFAVGLNGDYRLAMVVTEDGVKGSGSTYDQVNYYSYASQNIPLSGAGHNWQAEPAKVPAANMVYDFVAREIVGGFDGQSGSLPSSIADGSVHTYSFTSSALTNVMDPTKIKVHILLIDPGQKMIFNAKSLDLSSGSGTTLGLIEKVKPSINAVKIFPNPAQNDVKINFNIEKAESVYLSIVNTVGKTVYTQAAQSLSAGAHQMSLDINNLSKGIYFINVGTNKGVVSQKLVKTE